MTDKLRSFRSVIDRTMNIGGPTEGQLDLINSRLSTPVEAKDIFVFPSIASNRNEDSFHSIMDDSSLENYANDYARGLPLLRAHAHTEFPIGKTFDGVFDSSNGRSVVWSYITRGIKLNEKVSNDDVIRGIETGLIQDNSIRFRGGIDTCNLCNERLYTRGCRHIPGEEYDGQRCTYTIKGANARELSLVSIGSTPDAGVIRKVRMLWTSKQITEEEITNVGRHMAFNVRSAIEGAEYAKFDFETDDGDDDDDKEINATKGQPPFQTTASNTVVTDPATGLTIPDNKPKNGPHGPTASTFKEGRSMLNPDEKKGFETYYKRILSERAAELSPEMKRSISTFLDNIDDDEKRGELPVLTFITPAPDPDAEKVRHFKPEDGMTVIRYIRETVERAALASATNPVVPGAGGTVYGGAKIPPTELSGIPAPGTKPGMASDELIMAGQGPIQDVNYKGFTVVDGPPVGDAQIAGANSLSVPGLEITPQGVIKWMSPNAGHADMGEATVGGMVVGRSEEFKEKYIPLRASFDDKEFVRSLLEMAIDGASYRADLLKNLVRYGCLVEGDEFDSEFHLRIANDLSTRDLALMTSGFRSRVNEKFKTSSVENLSIDDFPDVSRRSTQSPPNPAKRVGTDNEPVIPAQPHLRAELFAD